jgi:hypothetical protein
MRISGLVLLIVVGVGPSSAFAQGDFSALKVKLGETVYVTTAGTTIRGTVNALSSTSLTVDSREFRPGPDLKIERAGAPLWRGALIGAGIATLAVPLVYPHNRDKIGTTMVAGLVGAAWGAWLTHAIWGRSVVYWAGPNQVTIGFGGCPVRC